MERANKGMEPNQSGDQSQCSVINSVHRQIPGQPRAAQTPAEGHQSNVRRPFSSQARLVFHDSPLFPPVNKDPPEHLSETSRLYWLRRMEILDILMYKKKKVLKSNFPSWSDGGKLKKRKSGVFFLISHRFFRREGGAKGWVLHTAETRFSEAVAHRKVEFLASITQKRERFESRGALGFTGRAQQEVTQHHLLLL